MEKAKITRHFLATERAAGWGDLNLYCGWYGGRVLAIAEIFRKGSRLPAYRIFMDVKRHEYFTEDLTYTKQRYTAMGIRSLLGWGEAAMAKGREKTIGLLSKELFGTTDAIKGIHGFQEKSEERKLKGRSMDKYLDSWRIRASGGELPGDFHRWLRRALDPVPFAFVKGDSAVCECGQGLPKGKNGQKGVCPRCGEVIYKNLRGQCRKTFEKRGHIIQPYLDGYVVRSFQYRKGYRAGRPNYHIMENERTFFTREGSVSYRKAYDGTWDKYIWTRGRCSTLGWQHTEERLYPFNLAGVSGIFQYAALEQYAKGPVRLVEYLETYRKHQVVESYVKLGLTNLLNDRLPDVKGTRIKESAGLNSEELRFYQKHNIGARGDALYKRLKKEGIRLPEGEFLFFLGTGAGAGDILECMEGTTARRLARYLRQEKRSFGWGTLVERYRDYLRMAKELHYGLDDEFVRFPKNVGQAHNVAQGILEEQKCRKKHQKEDRRMKEHEGIRQQVYAFESKGYIVVVPKRSLEIVREGQAQHHCVASYIDRVADGQSTVLFLRRKKAPEKSFYTIEARKGEVLQCRGKYNGGMTEDVQKFMEQYEKVARERWGKYGRDIPSDDVG